MAAGVYVHVPFCAERCPYCDAATVADDGSGRRSFLDALVLEAGSVQPPSSMLRWIHLGGGTPSLLPGPELLRLRAALDQLPLQADPAFTLEVNPEDVSPEALSSWEEVGVTRVALGVQSFDDDALNRLGRRHDAGRAMRALSQACKVDGLSVSVELLFGLPGQGLGEWRRELETALSAEPDHVSCQQLSGASQVEDEVARSMLELAHEVLPSAGLQAYELGHFASSADEQAPHLLAAWSHEPYLGLGPSAASFSPGEGEYGRRFWNLASLDEWVAAIKGSGRALAAEEHLSRTDLALEMLMLGLRRTAGVSLTDVEERTHCTLADENKGLVAQLEQEELCTREGALLRPTVAGLLEADAITQRFVIS